MKRSGRQLLNKLSNCWVQPSTSFVIYINWFNQYLNPIRYTRPIIRTYAICLLNVYFFRIFCAVLKENKSFFHLVFSMWTCRLILTIWDNYYVLWLQLFSGKFPYITFEFPFQLSWNDILAMLHARYFLSQMMHTQLSSNKYSSIFRINILTQN